MEIRRCIWYSKMIVRSFVSHHQGFRAQGPPATLSGCLKMQKFPDELNENLEFAVLTGCLRIARESIFTGLNNFKVRGMDEGECTEYFGFTDGEVKEMLRYYGVEDRFSDMKDWYDGYHFGVVDVYCPWGVICQGDLLRLSRDAQMRSHWENSSSNAIVQDILKDATEITKDEIEALISGETVEKEIIPELTYADLDSEDSETKQTYLWSVLYSTGYLTDAVKPDGRIHKLVIPNKEVRKIYEDRVRSWFRVNVTGDTKRWGRFCRAVKNGEAETVQELFNDDGIACYRKTCRVAYEKGQDGPAPV